MVQSSPAASRREIIDQLAGEVTRTALEPAGLGPEERVLTRQRVQRAIEGAAQQAYGDVSALAFGDSQGLEADRFVDYLDNSYRQQRDRDLAQPDTETPPARRLAAVIVASDDRLKNADPALIRRAEYYVAHQVTVAADREVQKTLEARLAQPGAAAARDAAPAASVASRGAVRPAVGRGGASIG